MRKPTYLAPAFLVATLLATGPAFAAEPATTMNLWPGTAPGEKGDIGEEKSARSNCLRVMNVSSPTLAVYKPPKEKDTGAAVLICPGGGYGILAIEHEGTQVAEYLNSIGVTGIVLKYRVPRRKGLPKHLAPLQDVQRAMSLARHHAKDWGIDPERIGILGFSAGGHLSAMASNHFDKRQYEQIDEIDKLSCRPDFTVLVYPAYMLEGEKLVEELPIGPKTPPAIFIHAGNDKHKAEGSILYYLAMRRHNIPCELHIYTHGGHGFGMNKTDHPVARWPHRLGEWLEGMGFLRK